MSKILSLSLSSKARALELLKPRLKSAKVLPVFRFTIKEYFSDKLSLINKASQQFKSSLIVRSSSVNEDNEKTSNAGGFDSVMNVSCSNITLLKKAIDKVVDSYGCDISDEDEVFIQPMLENVELAGVIFSADIDTLSDYYIVNYDESGSTDSVTSGRSNNLKTFVSFKNNTKFNDKRMEALIASTKECENIFNTKYLDVEFAYSVGILYILQVRPIVTRGKDSLSNINLEESLEKIRSKIENLNKKHPNLLGDKTIFGIMPDWNPAEIIGLRPKRLALSLYKELITDETWASQRSDYGYRDLRSHPLLVSFLGIPYIDVRVSFNSFVPAKLDEKIAEKLVNYYICKLDNNKKHHDKIEFKIVLSCYYFGIKDHLSVLACSGFNDEEIDNIDRSLLEITNNIIHPKKGLYKKDLNKVKKLHDKFHDITSSELSLIDKIYWLIKDVKKFGTLPFAGVARAGFIAVQFLKSFVSEGIITSEEYNLFLKSLNTVSKELVKDKEILSKCDFLGKYGHLRPGSYDILSKNYEQDYDNYFSDKAAVYVNESFCFTKVQISKINAKLLAHKLDMDFGQLITFIKEAIEGREYVKFEFVKSLNKILIYITEFGQQLKYGNIGIEELAHLDVQEIISLYSTLDHRHVSDILKSDIKKNREFYKYTKAIKLPDIISSSEDVYSFIMNKNIANFITLKSVNSVVVREGMTQGDRKINLSGKIICIKSADPGYDYLFSRDIGGLITCYGGANSHMAIRCSELGIPAAIGCGERDFNLYNDASILELDAGNQKVTILR
jgi:glutamine kinase